MKKLVATAPRVAALVEYEDRAILANEVKIRVRFGAPKHGTEVVDFRAASPFIDEDFNGEWQMFTPRPADAPRSLDGDRKMVSDSLRVLEQVAARTGTVVYLEPLNRYQDHMINTLADARRYIVENDLKHVQIIGDFYHMNIEEDNLAQALHDNRDLLGHVHIADNHRYQPGSGTLDFHALFEQLRADNYQGYVVYEGRIRAEDPAQAYRDSLAWLRTC
ncbi:TPA: TIM barrel protein [Escherichia coli]